MRLEDKTNCEIKEQKPAVQNKCNKSVNQNPLIKNSFVKNSKQNEQKSNLNKKVCISQQNKRDMSLMMLVNKTTQRRDEAKLINH